MKLGNLGWYNLIYKNYKDYHWQDIIWLYNDLWIRLNLKKGGFECFKYAAAIQRKNEKKIPKKRNKQKAQQKTQ